MEELGKQTNILGKDFKYLMLDLDGTLLDSNKRIPDFNLAAINKLAKAFGIVPVIATARPLGVANYIADHAKYDGQDIFQKYIIACNGALVYDRANQTYLVNKTFSLDQIQSLLDLAKELDLEYEFMTQDCEVADNNFSNRRAIDPIYEKMGLPFNYQNDIYAFLLGQPDNSIPLFAITADDETQKTILKERLATIKGIQVESWTRDLSDGTQVPCFDIMPEGVSKAEAIHEICIKERYKH